MVETNERCMYLVALVASGSKVVKERSGFDKLDFSNERVILCQTIRSVRQSHHSHEKKQQKTTSYFSDFSDGITHPSSRSPHTQKEQKQLNIIYRNHTHLSRCGAACMFNVHVPIPRPVLLLPVLTIVPHR